jgi:galactose mutarotase-like enzyme
MTGGSYLYRGNTYSMDIHGFLKDSDMDIVSKSDEAATFRICDSAETRRQYPFLFILEIRYRLSGVRIDICFHIKNTGGDNMYFGLGGHPGFRVPLAEGENFEDYYLEFPAHKKIKRIAMSEACFTTDTLAAFPLREGAYLDLKHDLFDDDAIVLENTGGRAMLKSRRSDRGIELNYPDMKYLGLWHKPRTKAPFLCIEPWTSLPSREGVTEDISKQENLISLKAVEEYSNLWSITII